MKRRKKRLTINGLFLWKVQLETVGLWITTRRESSEDAIKKARKVMAQDYSNERIKCVSSHGTLDA